MPLKKYINGSWVDTSYKRYETGTDAVTNLPVTILTDGQPVTSWTMKGNATTSGTPSPQNPVTISGVGNETANLLNWSYFEDGYYLDNTTGLPAIYTPSPSRIATTSPIDVSDFNNVTFSFTANATVPLYIYSLFNGNTLIRRVANNANGASIDTSEGDKLYLCVYSNSSNITTSNVTKAMLNEGTTALPYDEYNKYKISILKDLSPLTPMYFSQQLMLIGDTTDDYSSSGTATYNTNKYVLTGNENWLLLESGSGSTEIYQFYTDGLALGGIAFESALSNIAPYGMTVNTRTSADFGVYLITSGTNIGFQMRGAKSNFADVTAWKTYLQQQYAAGTPVTVYYVLATATTETVTAPSIPTTGGEVTLDVDTTVKPSELDLTYHGWHEHEPLKRENGAWV